MTAEFDEVWLRAYQARTGCGAREYGKGTTSSVSCADTFPTAVAPLQPTAGATSPRSDLKNRRGAAESRQSRDFGAFSDWIKNEGM